MGRPSVAMVVNQLLVVARRARKYASAHTNIGVVKSEVLYLYSGLGSGC